MVLSENINIIIRRAKAGIDMGAGVGGLNIIAVFLF